MSGKFQWCKFSAVDLNDPFFDSLKADYYEFPEWFRRKSIELENALVFTDDKGIGAFLYLKNENEAIALEKLNLPAMPRIKIGTLCVSERFRNQRLGEGALGVSLWKWQENEVAEIYVTVFDKHTLLINLFEHFGFKWVGNNARGERVYLKSRNTIDYTTPYTAFPFIRPDFTNAGVIPIFDSFHDRLFPYSELMGNNQAIEEVTAGNGITKIYIGAPYSQLHHQVGDPVAIYRIHQGDGQKTYKSVITSYCTLTKIDYIKKAGRIIVSLDEYIASAGNKTVFSPVELARVYNNPKHMNIVMLEMVYNGFFGKGHNVTHRELEDAGLFPNHPYTINYSKNDFIRVLEMGDVNVQNTIIDQSGTC